MVISKTPLRVSFVGGSTDIPVFFQKHEGAVVSTAINRYIYITVHKRFDGLVRVRDAEDEMVDDFNKIKHNLLRECLKFLNIPCSIDIACTSDIPSGTGLGSSSTFTVGALHALHAYLKQKVTAKQLAEEACEIELTRCHAHIGKQDQYAAAWGGLNFIKFKTNGEVTISPLKLDSSALNNFWSKLLFFYTGQTRKAEGVLNQKTVANLSNGDEFKMLCRMAEIAYRAKDSLINNRIEDFAKLLNENWELKSHSNKYVSNENIDKWLRIAKSHGAWSGKILGAGAGGFLLVMAPESTHAKITSSLHDLLPVKFAVENKGSQIVFNDETVHE